MQRWENKSVTVNLLEKPSPNIVAILNRFGKDGWELGGTIHETHSQKVFFLLKRPIRYNEG